VLSWLVVLVNSIRRFCLRTFYLQDFMNIHAMKSNPPRPHVFYHETHGVFSSLNAEEMPVFPVPRMGHYLEPLEALRTLWADNRYIFLGLVPLSPRLDTPPFDVIRSYTVIQHNHGGWGLTLEAAKRWCCLESILIDVAKIALNSRELYFPLDAKYPLPPSKFGFGVTHISEKGAKLAIHKSRAAFLLLMAYISLLFMSVSQTEADCSAWLHKTLIGAGLSYDDVKAIIESEITDFSPSYPRAGVIIDQASGFNHYVRTFVRRKVPVWLYWGNRPSLHKLEVFSEYMPTQDELSVARWCERHRGPRQVVRQPVCQVISQPVWHRMSPEPALPVADSPPPDNLSDHTASRPPSPSCNLPPPNPGYGQLKGETWREYFDRRAKIREQIIANETSSERQKRVQVEKTRSNFAVPGKKGSPVYRWRRNKDGFWLRTPVTRNEVADRWQQFTNTQKRFDSILNQWDLCKELDTDTDVEDDNDQQTYDDYMGVDTGAPSLPLPSASSSLVTPPPVSSHIVASSPT
jgi:hypothetical protein